MKLQEVKCKMVQNGQLNGAKLDIQNCKKSIIGTITVSEEMLKRWHILEEVEWVTTMMSKNEQWTVNRVSNEFLNSIQFCK